jgi:hypothetical protein
VVVEVLLVRGAIYILAHQEQRHKVLMERLATPMPPTGVEEVEALEQTVLLALLVVTEEQDYLPQSLVLQ